MSQRYQGGFLTASYNGLKVPDAPTIGTATAGNLSASVTFTAPSNVGGGAITGYTVISSPGGITGTGSSSPITVSGLTNGTAYTFTVVATNIYGTSVASAASNSATPAIPLIYLSTSQTYTFSSTGTCFITAIGGGAGGGSAYNRGGGGGGSGYVAGSTVSVTAGQTLTVTIGAAGAGGTSYGSGGSGGTTTTSGVVTLSASGGSSGISGGSGGAGGDGGGGGGSGGYTPLSEGGGDGGIGGSQGQSLGRPSGTGQATWATNNPYGGSGDGGVGSGYTAGAGAGGNGYGAGGGGNGPSGYSSNLSTAGGGGGGLGSGGAAQSGQGGSGSSNSGGAGKAGAVVIYGPY